MGRFKQLYRIDVKLATDKLKEAFKNVSTENTNKAIVRAINHTLKKANTEANKAIRARYHLPQDEINSRLKLAQAYYTGKTASGVASKSLCGYIYGRTDPIPLARFNPVQITGNVAIKRAGFYRNTRGKKVAKFAPTKSKPGVIGVTVQILEGQNKTIKSAFISMSKSGAGAVKAPGKYGPTGFVFQNEGPSQKTILNSKSVYYALSEQAVRDKVNTKIGQEYNGRLLHELNKGLKYAKPK